MMGIDTSSKVYQAVFQRIKKIRMLYGRIKRQNVSDAIERLEEDFMDDIWLWQADYPHIPVENCFNYIRPLEHMPDIYEYYDPVPYGKEPYDSIEVWMEVGNPDDYIDDENDNDEAIKSHKSPPLDDSAFKLGFPNSGLSLREYLKSK